MEPAKRDAMLKQLADQLAAVGDDLAQLHLTRDVYRRLMTVAGENPRFQRGNYLFNWMSNCYACYACVAVRRLLDLPGKHKPVSLGTIIVGLAENPGVMTREQFVARRIEGEAGASREFCEREARATFDRFEDPEETSPNLAVLRSTLDEVRDRCESVIAHVNQRVAHRDKSPSSAPAKWGELDTAIDDLGDLYNRVSVLLDDSYRALQVPELAYRWEWILKEPWVVDHSGP